MKLFVAIVNFRVPALVIDCLHSLADQVSSLAGTKVAVCENGSDDNSATLIRNAIDTNGWGGWCEFKVSPDNLGFTGGNNVLIGPALQSDDPPDYVLLLNPDTIVRPNALTSLVEFMDQNQGVGIAGSRLEDPDGTAQRSAFRFQTILSEFEGNLRLGPVSKLLSRWIVAPSPPSNRCQTDWVSGASMLVRREVFTQIGLLDEDYFTYFEDIDFCFNARRRGWGVWYVPESRVVHLVGKSSGVGSPARRLPPYLLEARRRYFVKNYGKAYAALADAAMLAGGALQQVRAALDGSRQPIDMLMLGDAFQHSVFAKGFALPVVQSPAAQKAKATP